MPLNWLDNMTVLHTLINLRAPLVTKKISRKPSNPWMPPAVLPFKRHHRYLEHVWCRNPTTLNRSWLTRQTHLCNRQMSKAKSAHYSKIIAEHWQSWVWTCCCTGWFTVMFGQVQSCMSMNQLKLNPDKTEFLFIGNEQQWRKYLSMFPIELFGVKTNPAKSARNLWVILDRNFTFRSHISAVCSSCFYHMRDLRRIHRHLWSG